MHFAQNDVGFVGSNAIVAGHIGIAGGIALAHKLDESGRVVAVFFGDGASCEGVFYEALNMATLWKLPLIFVCENNEYAISTHFTESISVPFIAQRAQGFGLPGVTIDGRDFYAVYKTTQEAADRARRGEGPTLIEAKTVRWMRHSAVAAGAEKGERWKDTDPLPRFKHELMTRGILSEGEVLEIERAAAQEIQDAADYAIASPYPTAADLFTDIFA